MGAFIWVTFLSLIFVAYQVSTGCDISQEQVQKQAELHWAQIRGAYGKGLLHTSQLMRRTQSEIAIQNAGHRMSSFCKNPVENVEEKNAIEDCAQASTDRTSHSIETENRLSFEGEQGVTLPPIPSNIAGITARALQRTMSDHSRASQPCLASSMAVSMQAALLPLGASLQNQGGRLEIISVTSEDRTPVRRQGRILPPITLGQNKIWIIIARELRLHVLKWLTTATAIATRTPETTSDRYRSMMNCTLFSGPPITKGLSMYVTFDHNGLDSITWWAAKFSLAKTKWKAPWVQTWPWWRHEQTKDRCNEPVADLDRGQMFKKIKLMIHSDRGRWSFLVFFNRTF